MVRWVKFEEDTMTESMMEVVSANGVELEVEVQGSGEPVVLIQTALVADEFGPLATEPALRDHYQVIRYHRRGYVGSAPADHVAASIARDAADCAALLTALCVQRGHIVGLSYSGAVAMQLAVDAPGVVHSLALLEPPPVATPSAERFFEAVAAPVDAYNAGDAAGGADILMTLVAGPHWRSDLAAAVPGAPEQVDKDAATFFESDWPALRAWRFGAEEARRITQPVLHIGGSDSGAFFEEVRTLVRAWLPHTEDVVLAGADHALAITHPSDVAAALVAFWRNHPITSQPPPPRRVSGT